MHSLAKAFAVRSHNIEAEEALDEESEIWAVSRQNQQNDLCTQQRLRSAWASAQSSLSAWRNLGPLTTYWAHSEDFWSDWADAQADLSLR